LMFMRLSHDQLTTSFSKQSILLSVPLGIISESVVSIVSISKTLLVNV